ncbi:glycosyltransferase family 39 protein [Rhodoblastus acidophilus]|uniref:Glycosyltransferase family 39 protein n=1 Tax=Candidatus Rhodoblastus alkanivorans TaxID=2954117 RepID=A0ABS9Z510_9HYPH|nr:glycosyltransferase family 39 protein [Candidatus Rhodoblastus alkanivorans]MCI4679891.1 glycosyltransferase family 39 protein [Candidatus Rhodoblastus alkanivorans]MCI4682706.1 glycosyltransferase family 39 protein [Candidatus Rhodoblastus alkanivorans]MDI4640013.1 glycosyltransferase family 39 protein [Rhodoblastus acidophilus]
MDHTLSDRTNLVSAARLTAERRTLLLILAVVALRFVFAATTGLGVDESYTVATSRVLTLSTYDHPPLAWWIAHFTGKLLGESPLALRAPFVLLSGVTSWLLFVLTRRLFSAEAGFYAVFALALSPALGLADAVWILPDAPLLPAMLACAFYLSRVFFDDDRAHSPRYWLLAGLFAGLAMLSKYHGVLLFGGAGLFVLMSTRQRFWLATPWPWLAGLVALAVFSPVLIWNAQHHWVSFLFQGARSGAPRLHLLAPLALIGLQSLFLAPWIFFPLAALFLRALWRGPSHERAFFLACLGSFPIVLFTVVAFWSSHRVLPHWAAPGYLMIFPLLGREIAARLSRADGACQTKRQTNTRRALAAAAGFTLIAAAAVAALPRLPLPWFAGPRDPLIETLGWDDFSHALSARGWRKGDIFIAATRWLDAGKLDYALHGDPPVLCLSDDPRGFGLIRNPRNFIGRDALIVAPNLTLQQARARLGRHFDTIEPLAPVEIMAGGKAAITLDVYRATDFHDPAPEFSLRPAELEK